MGNKKSEESVKGINEHIRTTLPHLLAEWQMVCFSS